VLGKRFHCLAITWILEEDKNTAMEGLSEQPQERFPTEVVGFASRVPKGDEAHGPGSYRVSQWQAIGPGDCAKWWLHRSRG
jgi:hypothetical protein